MLIRTNTVFATLVRQYTIMTMKMIYRLMGIKYRLTKFSGELINITENVEKQELTRSEEIGEFVHSIPYARVLDGK